jgi:hypothetical protein
LAFAKNDELLDNDVMDKIGAHLGRGEDQVGSGHFWGEVWDDIKTVGKN